MSAETLRRAASLMRERATGARNNNPWIVDSDRPNVVLDPDRPGNDWDGLTVCEVPLTDGGLVDFPTVDHIASWHPAVALAVADWLEREADHHGQWHGAKAACRDLDQSGEDDEDGHRCECAFKDCYEHGLWHNCTCGAPDLTAALAVVRAYLGESL